MANKVKEIKQLKLVAGFVDGDTRTIALNDPRDGLTKADITAINGQAAACLVGDKNGADFRAWESAKIFCQKTTYVDI